MKIKEHIKKHKMFYACAATGVAFAGITTLIMREVNSQSIGRDVIVTASRDAIVAADRSVVNHISYISSRRKGSPSWVIRCLENNLIYTSQRKAAQALEISETNVSRQLNGLQETAQGYTFERICVAA